MDTSAWPVVLVDLLRIPVEAEEMDDFQAQFLALLHLAKHGYKAETGPEIVPARISIVMPLDILLSASLEQQWRAAKFITDVREQVASTIFCTALVISNPTVRRVFHIITQIAPLKSMHKVSETMEESMAWAKGNRARQLEGLEPCL